MRKAVFGVYVNVMCHPALTVFVLIPLMLGQTISESVKASCRVADGFAPLSTVFGTVQGMVIVRRLLDEVDHTFPIDRVNLKSIV